MTRTTRRSRRGGSKYSGSTCYAYYCLTSSYFVVVMIGAARRALSFFFLLTIGIQLCFLLLVVLVVWCPLLSLLVRLRARIPPGGPLFLLVVDLVRS